MPAIRPIESKQKPLDFTFPAQGLDLTQAYSLQRAGTTPVATNVRAWEPATGRMRGGSRPGLSKYIPAAVPGSGPIQELATIINAGITPATGVGQPGVGQLVRTLIAVRNGVINVTNPGATNWVTAINNTGSSPYLNTSGIIRSTPVNGKVWFLDGTHAVYYDPATNFVNSWTASAGTFPTDAGGNKCRLLTTYRGAILQSALLLDGQNWFQSAFGDPTNYDYSPQSVTPSQAISGNDTQFAGVINDIVTMLAPFTDDVCMVGGAHSIFQMSGPLMQGGRIDVITDSIGAAFGMPYCLDPNGTMYFVSNRMGIYSMAPNNQPQRLSQSIESQLYNVDMGANLIRLLWNDRMQGLHVFVSPTAAPGATTNFFWEQRTQGWMNDTFTDTNKNPLCVCTFDGNRPGDRWGLLGSWDGYVRALDATATTDDGDAIASKVMLGPILSADRPDVLLDELSATMGTNSSPVQWDVFLGTSAEAALAGGSVLSGIFPGDRSFTALVRRSGHAVWLQLSSSNAWAMEHVTGMFDLKYGKPRRKGKN